MGFDSGSVSNKAKVGEPLVVWSQVVRVPNASWLQVRFDGTKLGGNLEILTGAQLRIMSLRDGHIQYFDAHHLAQWNYLSAVFNGDAVVVDVLAHPGESASRVRIPSVIAGEPALGEPDSICGTVDDRILSSDPKAGRIWSIGCTGWMFDDRNNQFGTAGHCLTSSGTTLQFNVPLSNSSGGAIAPPPEHQYAIEMSSRQSVNGGIGNDWGYFAVVANSNTGLMPFQAQGGVNYRLAATAPPAGGGQIIRITGYGTVSGSVPREWNLAQKTHTGSYTLLTGTNVQYAVDTTGGNSGSAVLNETTGFVIGVHTHAGCSSSGGANNGTARQNAGWTTALNNPLGICKAGNAPVSGPVYVSSDSINKWGTVNTTTGVFGNISHTMPGVQGLAFDRDTKKFIGVNNARKLVSITLAGVVTEGATLSGTAVINALAYDPRANTLYGMAEANGQLYTIDIATGVMTAVGSPGAGSVGGMDFDPTTGVIYAIDDAGGASRLVKINPRNGSRTLVGALGAGITDCDGLAYHEDTNTLYTINDANEMTYAVSTTQGTGTPLGPTGSAFGPVYGMAASTNRCTANFDNAGGLDIFDFLAFQNAFAASDPRADMNNDGLFDIFDFLGFQNAYAEGCP